jgi:tRNA nucleotidyltransferase (CCA-adding enzyme)
MRSGEELAEAFAAAYPELAEVAAAAPDPVYLVGGAVRDLLLGRGRADIDLVVEGDPAALAAALGAEVLERHSRFGTFKVSFGGEGRAGAGPGGAASERQGGGSSASTRRDEGGAAAETLDIAASRRETYARPGALPAVDLGAPIRTDLARRDFTVNAMAIPLADPSQLIDPYDGMVDLEAGVLRIIHDLSFVDDPTRAIRAARYATRFGFGIEERTRELLLATDLGTITADRRWAELLKLAEEETAPRALELLVGWGLLEPREGGESFALTRDVNRLMAAPSWSEEADRPEAILAAALGPPIDLTWSEVEVQRPSEGVALAKGHDPLEIVLARAAGATWLDDWLAWRDVRLEITGTDLTAAGLEGPAIGQALDAALRARLDGGAPTRADELRVALAATDTKP